MCFGSVVDEPIYFASTLRLSDTPPHAARRKINGRAPVATRVRLFHVSGTSVPLVMSASEAMKCCQDCVNRNDFSAAHSLLFGHRHLDRVIGPAPKNINFVLKR